MADLFLDESDVEIRAQSALSTSSIFALRKLVVKRQGENLKIQGRVKSFYEKQLAQEVVRSCAGGLEVVNGIVVD